MNHPANDDLSPHLTRRRDPDAQGEIWYIWFDGVRVGRIEERTGAPAGSDRWAWQCGFYTPYRDNPREPSGPAPTYKAAREAFLKAWAEYQPKRSPEDFDDWRHREAWTAEKYARWDRGERSAPPWPLPGFVFRHQRN